MTDINNAIETALEALPFGLDPRYEVRLHPDGRRAIISGNSHGFTGRFSVFVLDEGGYGITVSKSDIASAEPLAEGWIQGFLSGSEPAYDYAGIDALEDDWRERGEHLRRTGRSLPLDSVGGYVLVAAWRSPRPQLNDVADGLDELLRVTSGVFDLTGNWEAPLSWVPGQQFPPTVPDAARILELLNESVHEYSEDDLSPWSGMSDAKHLIVTSPETEHLRRGFIRIRAYTGLADDSPPERVILTIDPVDEWPESVDVQAALARLFATLIATFDPELAWAGPGSSLRSQGFPLFEDYDDASEDDAVPGIGLKMGWRNYFSDRSGIDTSRIVTLPGVTAERTKRGLVVTAGNDPVTPDDALIQRARDSIPGWS